MSVASPPTNSLDGSDLSSLFTYLIELCSTKADSNEQQSIAQVIRPLFTKTLESSPSFYRFLNPLASTPKANTKNKKEGNKKTPNSAKKIVRFYLLHWEHVNEIQKKKSSKSPQRKRKDSADATPSRPSSAKERQQDDGNISLDAPAPHISQDEIIEKLLKAIEFSQDEVATIVLCSLLRGYAVACKDPSKFHLIRWEFKFDFIVGQRRLRRLVRLDAANYCLRAMRPLFNEKNPSPLQIMATDALSLALIHVSAKDRKITLKVRLSGIIPLFSRRVMEAERLWTSSTILRLICRCCLRSGTPKSSWNILDFFKD